MAVVQAIIDQWTGPLGGIAISCIGLCVVFTCLCHMWEYPEKHQRCSWWLLVGLCVTFHRLLTDWPSSFLFALVLLSGSVMVSFFIRSLQRQYRKKETVQQAERSIESLVVIILIIMAVVGVTLTGLITPQAMVGDEVTHYYMLVTQAKDLSVPNFYSEIPNGYGNPEIRCYPHSFLWHYLGAIFYKFTRGSFWAVQLFHSFFFAQLLIVAWLIAASIYSRLHRVQVLYIIVLASLPVCLLLSVVFYQDVPMTAQILTAYYLLFRNRWLAATFFLALALGIKVTAMLFFPSFFLLLLFRLVRKESLVKGSLIFICSCSVILLSSYGLGKAINHYAGAIFYPQEKVVELIYSFKKTVSFLYGSNQVEVVEPQEGSIGDDVALKTGYSSHDRAIIANHPGDLRVKNNFLIYGGGLLWLLVFWGSLWTVCGIFISKWREKFELGELWLWFTGMSYLMLAFIFVRTAPDARFFFPGLPFILLPLAKQSAWLVRNRYIFCFVVALAMIQAGLVLVKVRTLREVSPDIRQAIEFLAKNPPDPERVFMYPEGNYRLFPVPHEWYLGYGLRDFWRGDNEFRLKMLRDYDIGAVVIKKHLISTVDADITDLGVYPVEFIYSIGSDPRFHKVFENQTVLIYQFSSGVK